MWTTAFKECMKPHSRPLARCRRDLEKISTELAQYRRAQDASTRDVVNSIVDTGPTERSHLYK